MENSPSVNGSYNASSDILYALAAPGLVGRLLGCCFDQRGKSSLYLDDELTSESWPCSILLNDQDSSIFQVYVEPQLDWELEPYDSMLRDSSPSGAFQDWEVPVDSGPADLEKCTQDIVLVDDDFDGGSSQSSCSGRLFVERLRLFAAGFVIHFASFCLFFSVSTALPNGFGGISDKPIFVRIPVRIEIETPDIPSRASFDTPASTASLARRHPKPEEAKPLTELTHEGNKLIEKPESDASLTKTELAEEAATADKKIPPDVSLRDGPSNDSKSSQDSIASTPSVATPERKGALKAGDEAEGYKDRILSAIHQAAYFPKAAQKKLAFGKAVVSFTINKDGSLANVSIVDHSKSETLDEAALKIVQQASSQFPPIPDELMRDHVTYVVPIVFKKRDQTSLLDVDTQLAAAPLVANGRRN